MRVADLHCDVVSRLLQDEGISLLHPDGKLDVTVPKLREGGVSLQVFALFLPECLPLSPESVFRAAETFWHRVMIHPELRPVIRREDLAAAEREGKIGAVLSLEGADGLQGQWWALRLLHRLGLRLLGPTWNRANWACDGATEPRGGGLTKAGVQLVGECEALGILLDVSHLSERGFWDLAEAAGKPFFASHSNAQTITPHKRNLTDDQIRALVSVDGLIGVTFVPRFLTDRDPASIDDVLRHVEYICALGGARHLAFGSDFDGIERHVQGLAGPADYPLLAEALRRRYPDELTRGFLADNARRFFTNNLPA